MNFASAWRPWWTAFVVAALVGWWMAPLPGPVTSLVRPKQDNWRLAPLPRRVDQTSTAAMVSAAGYWGAAAALPGVAVVPAEDPRWRIAAIFGAGKERGALVQFAAATKPPLRLRAGDTLPSGHRIVTISDREVCVQIGRKTYRLGVEQSGS